MSRADTQPRPGTDAVLHMDLGPAQLAFGEVMAKPDPVFSRSGNGLLYRLTVASDRRGLRGGQGGRSSTRARQGAQAARPATHLRVGRSST